MVGEAGSPCQAAGGREGRGCCGWRRCCCMRSGGHCCCCAGMRVTARACEGLCACSGGMWTEHASNGSAELHPRACADAREGPHMLHASMPPTGLECSRVLQGHGARQHTPSPDALTHAKHLLKTMTAPHLYQHSVGAPPHARTPCNGLALRAHACAASPVDVGRVVMAPPELNPWGLQA